MAEYQVGDVVVTRMDPEPSEATLGVIIGVREVAGRRSYLVWRGRTQRVDFQAIGARPPEDDPIWSMLNYMTLITHEATERDLEPAPPQCYPFQFAQLWGRGAEAAGATASVTVDGIDLEVTVRRSSKPKKP